MISYKELIKDDNFDKNNSYLVNTSIAKSCWGCEKGNASGYMVWNNTKQRRIFFCEDCLDKI